MRHRHRQTTSAKVQRTPRPLGGDIVALLRRALHEEEYAVAEHLLQALEELERGSSDCVAIPGCSRDLEVAYLEIARSLGPKSQLCGRGTPAVEASPEHCGEKQ